MPDTSSSGATALAEQIRLLVTRVRIRLANGHEHTGHVTVSLGVTAADIGDTLESLIERADGALYAAKRAGRNQVSLAQGPRAPV
jgi:diguanylate cyclase